MNKGRGCIGGRKGGYLSSTVSIVEILIKIHVTYGEDCVCLRVPYAIDVPSVVSNEKAVFRDRVDLSARFSRSMEVECDWGAPFAEVVKFGRGTKPGKRKGHDKDSAL